jgi:hypothetical protein
MSNDDRLFAFRSGTGELCYTVRVPPHRGVVKLADEDFETDLSNIKRNDELATIVATKKLTVTFSRYGLSKSCITSLGSLC